MEDERAREILKNERTRLEALLRDSNEAAGAARVAVDEPGGFSDPAEPLTEEAIDDAVAHEIRSRLEAIGRAEHRLAEGTYGRSIRSGRTISDERLEADPAAELTLDEAEEG